MAVIITLCLCLDVSASHLGRHDYFTDEALADADVEGLDGEIALAIAGFDAAYDGATNLAASLSGHDKMAVEGRLEMAIRLKDQVSRRASTPERDELLLAWQGAKELESFTDYFARERRRHEEKAAMPEPQVFNVKDFGARGDGTGNDGPAFLAAVEAARALGGAPSIVLVPSGTYRIEPDPAYPVKGFTCRDMSTGESRGVAHPYAGERIDAHLVLKDLDNLTVRGEGMGKTILVLTDSSRGAIRICGCKDVFIEDLSVDLEMNPSTQGTIEKVKKEPFALFVRIDDGFPSPDTQLYMDATSRYFSPVDANGYYLPGGVARMGPTVENVGDRLFKIAPSEHHLQNPVWRSRKPGDRIAILARYAEGRSGSPRLLLSAFCGAKNVDVRDSAGQVFTETSCYASSFIGCRATGRGDGDIVTANADSMLSQSIIGPYVSDCVYRGLEDDGINIGTNQGELSSIPSDGRYHHPDPGGGAQPHVGAFIADSVNGRIKMFVRLGADGASTRQLPASAVSSRDIAEQREKAKHASDGQPQKTGILRADRVIRIPGTVGAILRNCEFSRIRGRGIQVHCADMLIENVYVADVTSCGISVHGMLSWGMCFDIHNILVRGCEFRRSAEVGARLVLSEPLVEGEALNQRMYFDIEFDRCVFEPASGYPAARVGNVDNVLFKDCTMVCSPGVSPVAVENATNVRVDGMDVSRKRADDDWPTFLKCEKTDPAGDGPWNFPDPRPEVKTLKTTACAIGLDMSRRGTLEWFRSCAKGTEFAANDGSSLFALSFLHLADTDAEPRVLTAADAVDFQFEAAPREIRLVYSGFPACARRVVCTVSVNRGDNKIYWDIETEVAEGWALVNSDYPVLALKRPPDVYAPFASSCDGQSLFYMAAEDAGCAEKKLNAFADNGAFRWAWRRTAFETGKARQGYKVATSAMDGLPGETLDWQDAAAIYREWSLAHGDDPQSVTLTFSSGMVEKRAEPFPASISANSPKVVFLGNSINGTPPSKRWDGDWGMAASWPCRDYVSRTVKGIEDLCGRRVEAHRRNLSEWERNLATYDVKGRLADLVAFKPDIVVIALGENVPSLKTEADQALFREKLAELAAMFKDAGAKIVIRSPFWRRVHMREICEEVAREVGAAYADLNGCGSDDPSLLALGSTNDSAVAGHPGDEGMARIAEVVLNAISEAGFLSEDTNSK